MIAYKKEAYRQCMGATDRMLYIAATQFVLLVQVCYLFGTKYLPITIFAVTHHWKAGK